MAKMTPPTPPFSFTAQDDATNTDIGVARPISAPSHSGLEMGDYVYEAAAKRLNYRTIHQPTNLHRMNLRRNSRIT
jgi:hypothetical protein